MAYLTKMFAGGLNTKAPVQSCDETGVLRVQGHLVTVIEETSDFSAIVYDMLNLIPGYGYGAEGLYAQPFNPVKHRTRCFEIRERGLPYLAPANARPGDHVAVFLGGKVLFVVRMEDEGELGASGPCIIPPLMFGKLIAVARERGKEPLDFVLR